MRTKYKVKYRSYVVRENDYIRRNGFSCILFENRGNVPVLIDNAIELKPKSQEILEFNERPNTIIEHEFEIKFENDGANKQVLVIEAYYEEV